MQIPRGEIPKFAVVDDNTLALFLVESFTKEETKGGPGSKLPAGCLMFKAGLKVLEPAKDADLTLYDNFVVGSAEDPQAEDPNTWTSKRAFGARRLMEFLDAIGVTSEDTDEWESEAEEQQGQALVVIQTPTEGQYKGQPQNRIARYFKVGEAPSQRTSPAAGSNSKGKAVAPAPVTAKSAAQVQPATAKPATAAPPAKKTATPPSTARPGAPAAAPATPPASKAAARVVASKAEMFNCQLCGQDIPRDEFPTHVPECAAAQQAGNEGAGAEE